MFWNKWSILCLGRNWVFAHSNPSIENISTRNKYYLKIGNSIWVQYILDIFISCIISIFHFIWREVAMTKFWRKYFVSNDNAKRCHVKTITRLELCLQNKIFWTVFCLQLDIWLLNFDVELKIIVLIIQDIKNGKFKFEII